MSERILTLNAGSSSLKFALFAFSGDDGPLIRGQIDGFGPKAHFAARDADGAVLADTRHENGEIGDANDAMRFVLAWLGRLPEDPRIAAIGHRIVHGGEKLTGPARLDEAALGYLAALAPLAPLHQLQSGGVTAARAAFPNAAQIGCFDTAFHRGHAFEADAFALPRAYFDAGVRRYGFHGLSFDYIATTLRVIDPGLARGRVIIAHLGSGASMCAVADGRSVAATMGFSALDGLPMATRCGQIDPGVLLYLMSEKAMTHQAISDLLYKRSGLLGLSGLSGDMRALEASATAGATEAIGCFTYWVRREIGSLAAALGGLDGLVFTGGIGEHSARVRGEAVAGLAFLGIQIDAAANAANAAIVSPPGARVTIRVIRTDEETEIARQTRALLSR